MELEVLYEDEDVLVCYKPAGIATQTAKTTEQDMVSLVRNYRHAKAEDTYVGVIHRLDQPVEGILVFGKNAAAAAILCKELKERQFAKNYLTIVTRENIPSEGVLEDYIVKDGRKTRAMIVKEGNPRGKKARLSYKVLEKIDDQCLLQIQLDTGRFHQIRVQLASRTAPILGDVKYGGSNTGFPLCLCAYRLQFNHPVSEEGMCFEIRPRGEGFAPFMEKYKKENP